MRVTTTMSRTSQDNNILTEGFDYLDELRR
jgi:hypothetical protein